MKTLREGYVKLNDFEICKGISEGRISGQWMDKNDVEKAKTATKETATKILNDIDKNRYYSYNTWNSFN